MRAQAVLGGYGLEGGKVILIPKDPKNKETQTIFLDNKL